MTYCPLCNWKVFENSCTNWQCSYHGKGLTKAEIAEEARGYRLGALCREHNYPEDL